MRRNVVGLRNSQDKASSDANVILQVGKNKQKRANGNWRRMHGYGLTYSRFERENL